MTFEERARVLPNFGKIGEFGKLGTMDVDYDLDAKYWNNWTDQYLDDIDTSVYPFPNTLWHRKTTKEVVIKSTLMLAIGVTGLSLNSIILYIIIRNKWLWTPSNFLIGNMALVDFLTLLLCPWFMLVRDFYQNFVLKNFGCRFEGFLQASFLLAGVGAVMLISYDRLAAAALTADARVTKSAAPKLVVGTWVVSCSLALPWAIKRNYFERQWLDHLEMYCVEDVRVLGIYWHFMITICVWVPLGLMVITYGAIIWKLEYSARHLSSRSSSRRGSRARARALRIMACVLLASVVCRVPYTALIYWSNNMEKTINVVDGVFDYFWFAANYLMYCVCALNPLLYGFTNTRFRKAMDRTAPISFCRFGSWCCICPKCKQPHLGVEDKNTEKIFVIEHSPRPRDLRQVFKNILHINKECLDLSVQRNDADEITAKPTKVTPLKTDLL